ncbi:DUF4267 domain-containing protein [Myceligenerans crystallogenes]|uniref:DUF4267 domain-containing protein n=1 Tax=Myceligenerans crystallogenes TaxID=316335 RepID=A0ABP4ZSL9_9MICO
MKHLNTVLVALTVCAGLFFGLNFLVLGAGAAAGFGIEPWPTGNAAGYYTVKGVRDIAYGLTALVLLVQGQRRALAWVLLVDAVIPAGDMIAVMTHGGTVGQALAVHGTAVVLVLIASALLFLEQRGVTRDGARDGDRDTDRGAPVPAAR